jgi:hypothetical protein
MTLQLPTKLSKHEVIICVVGETYNKLVKGFFFEFIMKFREGYYINYCLKPHATKYIKVEP